MCRRFIQLVAVALSRAAQRDMDHVGRQFGAIFRARPGRQDRDPVPQLVKSPAHHAHMNSGPFITPNRDATVSRDVEDVHNVAITSCNAIGATSGKEGSS